MIPALLGVRGLELRHVEVLRTAARCGLVRGKVTPRRDGEVQHAHLPALRRRGLLERTPSGQWWTLTADGAAWLRAYEAREAAL